MMDDVQEAKVSAGDKGHPHERLLRLLAAATFVIFFQAYMVAPIIPRLASVLASSPERVGLAIPAYLIPYGFATLVYGVLSDRIGRGRIMLASLSAFIVLTALTATARTADQLTAWRFATGLGASAVVPLALALIGRLFPFDQRGRALGWLFGAMAGGMAFGSTFGAILEPVLGWRGLFLAVSVIALVLLALLFRRREMLGNPDPSVHVHLTAVLPGYAELLGTRRSRRTYAYVVINAIFHSGVYTWLGLYFVKRYGLGEIGIGLALLGYGVPGFLFGPVIGRAADRWGRRWLIPIGLALAAISAGALAFPVPLAIAAVAVTSLSLGYDMTQPLLAGIVTTLGGKRAGQAMGLNVFGLFVGFGLGSLIFSAVLSHGLQLALMSFAAVLLIAAVLAVPSFHEERPFHPRDAVPVPATKV
jgi:predicted MFS family arabinose efflux permease